MMMKICEIVRDLLPLYIDDVCGTESRKLVEEHLKSCRACQREYMLMKDPAPVEKKTENFTAVEEEILMAGKERIETGVKRRLVDKILWLDIFLNVFFLSLGIQVKDLFLHATKLPWYGKALSFEELYQTEHYTEFMQFFNIILACLMFLICDLVALIFKIRRQRTLRSRLTKALYKRGEDSGLGMAAEHILWISLFMKSLYAVIMTAIGFLYLYNELVILCR